jgi:multicomponent K+:H+ antiporter subunit F
MLAPMLAALTHLGPYTKWALIFAVLLFGISLLLNFYRLVVGPGTEDRILALDTLYINALAITVLSGIGFATGVFFEAALVIAMLGFVGTVVVAKFVAKGDIVR